MRGLSGAQSRAYRTALAKVIAAAANVRDGLARALTDNFAFHLRKYQQDADQRATQRRVRPIASQIATSSFAPSRKYVS